MANTSPAEEEAPPAAGLLWDFPPGVDEPLD